MALARYNGTVQDLFGTAVQAGSVTVIREGAGLEQLYSDREGSVPKDNPLLTEADGSFFFHAQGGAFKFLLTAPGVGTKEVRYIGVGLGSEGDGQGLTPRGLYSAVVTYELADMVKAGNYLFASRQDGNLNNTPDSTTPADTAYWMYLGPIAGTTEADILAALGITGVIISEDPPSGGIDGNLWLQL